MPPETETVERPLVVQERMRVRACPVAKLVSRVPSRVTPEGCWWIAAAPV